MRARHFKLQGHTPIPCEDFLEWAKWFENADDNRVVARTKVGDVDVSTVFLGLDRNWTGQGPPVLFESMVFGGPLDLEQERYCTWEAAVAGHNDLVARVRGGMN